MFNLSRFFFDLIYKCLFLLLILITIVIVIIFLFNIFNYMLILIVTKPTSIAILTILIFLEKYTLLFKSIFFLFIVRFINFGLVILRFLVKLVVKCYII